MEIVTKKLAILGAGGHAKVLADCAKNLGWKEIFYFDDSFPKNSEGFNNLIGTISDFYNHISEVSGVIVAIGDNRTRLNITKKLISSNAPLVSLIHPKAFVSDNVMIGAGSVILSGANVQVDVRIGDAVIINNGSNIDHECEVKSGAHISPGVAVAGNTSIGSCSWVGIGASISQSLQIGDYSIIGAGAAVISHIPNNSKYVGVPARIIHEQS